MEDMQAKLGAILSNPEMMQQIMAFAQNLSPGPGNPPQEPCREEAPPPFPAIDPAMLQKMAGMMQSGRIDSNQQFLLKALRPYISSHRIAKLERAMGAAKMAGVATAFLQAGAQR